MGCTPVSLTTWKETTELSPPTVRAAQQSDHHHTTPVPQFARGLDVRTQQLAAHAKSSTTVSRSPGEPDNRVVAVPSEARTQRG